MVWIPQSQGREKRLGLHQVQFKKCSRAMKRCPKSSLELQKLLSDNLTLFSFYHLEVYEFSRAQRAMLLSCVPSNSLLHWLPWWSFLVSFRISLFGLWCHLISLSWCFNEELLSVISIEAHAAVFMFLASRLYLHELLVILHWHFWSPLTVNIAATYGW